MSSQTLLRYARWLPLLLIIPSVIWGVARAKHWRHHSAGAEIVESEVALLPAEGVVEMLRTAAEACDAGDGAGCWRLRDHYAYGTLGLPKNEPHARQLCRKACDLGHYDACRAWQDGVDFHCPWDSE